MTTHDYMAALKAALGVESDYALAKALHIGQTTVSNWRIGKTTISDNYAPQIASILNVPAENVLVDLSAERERSPAVRDVWLKAAQRLAQAACLIVTVAALNITLAPRSEAATLTAHFFDSTSAVYKFPNCCTALAHWLARVTRQFCQCLFRSAAAY